MPANSVCPDPSLFRSVVQGERSAAEIDALAEHVEDCPRCAEAVERILPSGETLAEVLGVDTKPDEEDEDPAVQGLIERMQQMRPAEDPQTLDGYAPLGRNSSSDVTQLELDDVFAEACAWFAPAQQPDE